MAKNEITVELKSEKLLKELDDRIEIFERMSKDFRDLLTNKEIQMEGSLVLRGLRESDCCYHLPPGEFIKKYNLSKPGLICSLLESYHQYRLKNK